MKDVQKFATKVFITASVFFGINGILAILSTPKGGNPAEWLMKLLAVTAFIILSSFGVSVGFKYLSDK